MADTSARFELGSLRRFTVAEGILMLVLGALALLFPILASAGITLILAIPFLVGGIVFLVEGLVAAIVSLSHTRQAGWGWGLANGLVTLVLGLVILTMQPTGLLSVIGILVGISFLFSGVDLLVFSAGFHGPEKDSEQAPPS